MDGTGISSSLSFGSLDSFSNTGICPSISALRDCASNNCVSTLLGSDFSAINVPFSVSSFGGDGLRSGSAAVH